MNSTTKQPRKILAEVEDVAARIYEAALKVWPGKPGLGNYYEQRVKSGQVLNDAEKYLCIYVASLFPPDTPIVEIAAGGAQLSVALGCLGFADVLAIEDNIDRSTLAYNLGRECGLQFQSFAVREDRWQGSVTAPTFSRLLFVTVNAVSSLCSKTGYEDVKAFGSLFEKDCQVILNPSLYGTQDDTPAPPDKFWQNRRELPYGLVHWF